MSDHRSRYKGLIKRIRAGIETDPRDALRAQFELITLAYADRWCAIRLEDGAYATETAAQEREVRRNDEAARHALRTVQELSSP